MATHPFVVVTFALVFAFFGYFLFTFLMGLISGIIRHIRMLSLGLHNLHSRIQERVGTGSQFFGKIIFGARQGILTTAST